MFTDVRTNRTDRFVKERSLCNKAKLCFIYAIVVHCANCFLFYPQHPQYAHPQYQFYSTQRSIQSSELYKELSHFTSLADLFNQTPSQRFWDESSRMLQLIREGCSYTYPPMSIARYSFIQLSELEQCRVKTLAHDMHRIRRL